MLKKKDFLMNFSSKLHIKIVKSVQMVEISRQNLSENCEIGFLQVKVQIIMLNAENS